MEKGNFILEIRRASFGYSNRKAENMLLMAPELRVRRGELVCLIGRNGSGKSTFLKSVMKLIPLIDGEVLLNGRDIRQTKAVELARIAGFVPSGLISADEMTVRELVELGRFPYTNWIGKMTVDDHLAVEEAIDATGLAHLTARKLSTISDGEKQRAMIARTLAQDTPLILLDEPSAYLDIRNKFEIVTLLRSLCDRKRAAVFSTHDLNLALQYADKVWLIHEQTMVEGAPEDLVITDQLQGLFGTGSVVFDKLSGDFRPTGHYLKTIVLDPGNAGKVVEKWTIQALRRAGYTTTGGDISASRLFR